MMKTIGDNGQNMMGGQMMGQTMGSTMAPNPFAQVGVVDPQIMLKGLQDVRDEMKDMQREGHLIE
jgi:hypothetical protein